MATGRRGGPLLALLAAAWCPAARGWGMPEEVAGYEWSFGICNVESHPYQDYYTPWTEGLFAEVFAACSADDTCVGVSWMNACPHCDTPQCDMHCGAPKVCRDAGHDTNDGWRTYLKLATGGSDGGEHWWTRYDRHFAVRWERPGPRLSWAMSEELAQERGGRLLTLAEARDLMRDVGALYEEDDQWVACIGSDGGREWVQVATGTHEPGNAHVEDFHSYPPWGDNPSSTDNGEPDWNFVLLWTDGPAPPQEATEAPPEPPTTDGPYTCYAERVSWDVARDRCISTGGLLATVRDGAQNAALLEALREVSHEAWIGFSDRDAEGEWQWQSGAPVDFTNWNPGEPNDIGNEDCAVVLQHSDGRWNDAGCGAEVPYCCESRGPPAPRRPGVGEEVEVSCYEDSLSYPVYHQATVVEASAIKIQVTYERAGHSYYCVPTQWRSVREGWVDECRQFGGIGKRNKCCAAECGECGDHFCHLRPGGKMSCCTNRIPDEVVCGEDGRRAPCTHGEPARRLDAAQETILP